MTNVKRRNDFCTECASEVPTLRALSSQLLAGLSTELCSGLTAVPSLGFKSFVDVVKYDSIPRFIVPTVQYVSETYKQLMDEFCI